MPRTRVCTVRAPSPVTRAAACVHYACFTGQHSKVASSGSRGQRSAAVLLTSFAVLVCVGVNQGHSSLMGAQWLGCIYRPSTMQKVSDAIEDNSGTGKSGHLSKKIEQKSRNSWRENGGGVGAHEQLIHGTNLNKSYNQIKTLK